jgi:hypothetical protein
MAENKTVAEKVVAAVAPDPVRLKHLNWSKMAVWIGAISALWITVQVLVPDHIAHIVGTILLGVSNAVMFMMKSSKSYEQTGERRERE